MSQVFPLPLKLLHHFGLYTRTRRHSGTPRAVNWESDHVSPKNQCCMLTPLTLWAPCGASFLCRDGNWQGRMAARSPRHLCWQWWWPWGRQGDRHPQCLRCSQAPRLWMSPSIYHSGSSSGALTLCPVLKFLFVHPSCITELARPCFLFPGYRSLHLMWFYSLEQY